MADPYSGVPITGYNSNPPSDDGSQTEANRVKWATIKTKLNDPVKSRTDDMNTALLAAFAKMIGGAGITSTAISYTVLSTDQGKLVRATAAGITVTTPDATNVSAPFVFCLLNDSTGDITFDGSGSQTLDGDASITVPANCGLTVFTDGSNWFTTGQNFQRTLVRPQGYLSLIAVATQPTSPRPASDQSAKTSVFYRPDQGNLLPIPDGTNFAVREFSELTLTLVSSHVANNIYDVFAFADPATGAITIGTGPAWTTATAGSGARGSGAGTTELDILKGLLVNKVAMTARNGSTTYSVGAKSAIYLGSIFMDGTNGQVSCHVTWGQSRKWGVWNAYNRRSIQLRAGESTASWTYDTNTIRAAAGFSANSITVLSGLPDESLICQEIQRIEATDSTSISSGVTYRAVGQIGIGVNSTTAITGTRGVSDFGNTVNANSAPLGANSAVANAVVQPAIGIQTITALEISSVTAAHVVYLGTETNMVLTVTYNG